MKNVFFIPLVVLLFFAIIVGAMNITMNTNNRPYRLGEFIYDCSQITFDLSIVQDFIRGDSRAEAGGPDKENAGGHRGFDGEPIWDDYKLIILNVYNVVKQIGLTLAAVLDVGINIVNVIRQVVVLLWNFCVGVPIDPPSEASLPIVFRDFLSA